MTESAIRLKTFFIKLLFSSDNKALNKIWTVLLYAFLAWLLFQPSTRELLLGVLRDVYLAVIVFVAFTLAIFYILEDWFRLDVPALLKRGHRIQPLIAALVGALPGCGGAIMVVTQYAKGGISFGALIAVLTSTMGDAAFLLLARKPLVALFLFIGSAVVGTITGMLVDAIHGRDFLRSKNKNPDILTCRNLVPPVPLLGVLWVILLIPGIILGLADAFQVDVSVLDNTIFSPQLLIGAAGAILSLIMWDLLPRQAPTDKPTSYRAERKNMFSWQYGSTISRIINDTNFVTKWVLLAFLSYELILFFTNIDITELFRLWAPLVPLVGVLLGFIPGCGPQVVVTTLYVNGIIPFSAQLGNAISNDGDALFPALAIAPKASVVATLYSAIPAVILAYGWYWLFEI